MTQELSLAPTFTVALGTDDLSFTSTMGFIRRMGIVENTVGGPDVDGVLVTDLLLGAYREGTKRHHQWDDIESIVEDYTFMELIVAVREGMMARLGEVQKVQIPSP